MERELRKDHNIISNDAGFYEYNQNDHHAALLHEKNSINGYQDIKRIGARFKDDDEQDKHINENVIMKKGFYFTGYAYPHMGSGGGVGGRDSTSSPDMANAGDTP